MKLRAIKIIVSILFFVITLSAQNGLAQSTQNNLQNFLSKWRQKNHIPAAVLRVDFSDGTILNVNSGRVSRNGKTYISENNIFGVGSITKTFIAALILQLQEERKLTLDDRIGRWFPEYPRWQDITIRQLLNMTSGINNFSRDKAFKKLLNFYPSQHVDANKIIEIAYRKQDLFKPGKGWSYSNTNYFLLGRIIEKITQHSVVSELQKRFFIPLRLQHTFYRDDQYPKSVKQQMARGYYNGKDVTDYNPGYWGAGGAMFMNVNDLATWTKALFTPEKVLTEKSIQMMQETIKFPYEYPRPRDSEYGLGVFSLNIAGLGKVWWYSGVIDGYSSVFLWIPEKRIVVAAQINSWQGNDFDLLFPGQEFIENVLTLSHIK